MTGNVYDNGKFRVPSLRNIMLTAPYMHDGRFWTMEEVFEHYKTGGFGAENSNDFLLPFPSISPSNQQKIIKFLESLTDTTFLNNPAFADPFN